MPDTLRISYTRALTGQPVPEGAELTLTCAAGIQSREHTHLSITFGKRGGGDGGGSDGGGGGGGGGGAGGGGEVSTLREIISLDRALRVTPGSSRAYKRRYDDGEITLEKRNGAGAGGLDTYVARLSAVRPEDSGSYFCEASQWILDPDRSWQKIAQRTLEIGNLTVQRLCECFLFLRRHFFSGSYEKIRAEPAARIAEKPCLLTPGNVYTAECLLCHGGIGPNP